MQEHAVALLSVPSSSGKALELGKADTKAIKARSFSPLFIGEGSGTDNRWQPVRFYCAFQSPLHRGRLWNTRTRVSCGRVHIYFESPLHRGRLWNVFVLLLCTL